MRVTNGADTDLHERQGLQVPQNGLGVRPDGI